MRSRVKCIDLFQYQDNRGVFCKAFDWGKLRQQGIDFKVVESFWSSSRKNTIRGLHFQKPPYDCAKIVAVVSGIVLGVWLNLETGESGFKYLVGDYPRAMYIPKGYAYGFKAETDCTVLFFQDQRYSVYHDDGVYYKSVKAPWDCDDPILSERDKSFKAFNE